jgi:GNAT superfamily N-acetyltransferase
MRVVAAGDGDLQIVIELLSAASRRMAVRGVAFWWDPFPPDEVQESIARKETFLAYREDTVVGTIAVGWSDEPIWGPRPPDAGYIHRLAVATDVVGAGIGTSILDWAAEDIRGHGRSWIRLDTIAPDEGPRASLHRWYKQHGFSRVGEVDAPIVGEGSELIFYRTILYERKA